MLHIKQKTEADTSKKEIGIKKLVRLFFLLLLNGETNPELIKLQFIKELTINQHSYIKPGST